ncbi:hypothetical protein ACHAW6_004574 [Cyclotella cf. meneghiniana]
MIMVLPKGIESHHGSSKVHILMLLANLYGQKQAGAFVFSSHELMNVFSTVTVLFSLCRLMMAYS